MSSEALNRRFFYVTRPALIASIVIHLSIPIAFYGAKGLQALGILPKKKPLSTTEVYQNYIQVDVVGLPDELMNQRNAIDPTLPIVEKPAVDKEVTTKPDDESMTMESNKKAAEDKALAEKKAKEKAAKAEEKKKKAEKEKALKKLEKEAEREAALKALEGKGREKGRGKIAGNIKSQGTAMSGMIGTAKDQYTALVAQKIREHFNIFPWQKKKNLMAVVFIEIGPNGQLKDEKLMKASRDPVYDAAVLQAVKDAAPLPVPSDMSLVSDGINLEFRPEN